MFDESKECVYVDNGFCGEPGSWGKWTGGGHLQADTEEALHEFAARLGLRREWFQPGFPPEGAHYDLTASKRKEAHRVGANSGKGGEASRGRVSQRGGACLFGSRGGARG